MKIFPVPAIFQMPDMMRYPEDNWPDFECWFMRNIQENDLTGDRVYLPILFTAYFKRYSYGKDVAAVQRLQNFVDSLPKGLKYFCVIQYDDGVLIDWKGKDVAVFGMSGKPEGCIPIPLVCQPHIFKFPAVTKDIMCSFVGRITDPIRKTIVEWGEGRYGYYVTSRPHGLQHYCEILARSKFVLCPRGYGASSFRITEALQYGAMPIILTRPKDNIYRCPISIMYDYKVFETDDLNSLAAYMPSFVGFQKGTENIYNKFYSFEGVKRTILDGLWDLL